MESKKVRLAYDRTADALYLSMRPGKVDRTEPLDDSRIVDYDRAGDVLGYEFVGVSDGIVINGIPGEVTDYIQRRLPWIRQMILVHGTPAARGPRARTAPNGAPRHAKAKELV
jgi:uncharacterized protein YuzE